MKRANSNVRNARVKKLKNRYRLFKQKQQEKADTFFQSAQSRLNFLEVKEISVTITCMKILDLTHSITPDMPVYPGTEQPVIITGCSIDEVGFLEKKLTFFSHTGTHIDAPAHLIKGQRTLDMFPIDHFYGPGLLLNFENSNRSIGLAKLEPYQDQIARVHFVLLYTGWSKYWGSEKYFTDYPVLSLEAAEWLSEFPDFNLKGLGIDTLSADSAETTDYPVHKLLLEKNIIIIENLVNIEELHASKFNFSCFPLSFEDADGSPVRAVAYIS